MISVYLLLDLRNPYPELALYRHNAIIYALSDGAFKIQIGRAAHAAPVRGKPRNPRRERPERAASSQGPGQRPGYQCINDHAL